jgi:anti-sigma factor RsiW
MTCHELDSRLDDWVDGTLPQAEARLVEQHLGTCPACRAREQELRQLLAHAAALPRSVAPPRDLWPGIAEQIERSAPWWSRWGVLQPVALAAAAAVALGVAAFLWDGRAPATVQTVAMPEASPVLRPVSDAPLSDVSLAAAVRDYEDAASALLEALQRRRAVLPPEDLARVEANLEVIDRALAEVRQALVKDPASPELNRMLVATHRKKVDVLRRVVRLSTAL